jgi:hypothetical protein
MQPQSHFYCVELGGNPLVTAPLGLNPFVIRRLFGLFGLFGFNGLLISGLFGLLGLPTAGRKSNVFGHQFQNR